MHMAVTAHLHRERSAGPVGRHGVPLCVQCRAPPRPTTARGCSCQRRRSSARWAGHAAGVEQPAAGAGGGGRGQCWGRHEVAFTGPGMRSQRHRQQALVQLEVCKAGGSHLYRHLHVGGLAWNILQGPSDRRGRHVAFGSLASQQTVLSHSGGWGGGGRPQTGSPCRATRNATHRRARVIPGGAMARQGWQGHADGALSSQDRGVCRPSGDRPSRKQALAQHDH